jgi:hypothetical protein
MDQHQQSKREIIKTERLTTKGIYLLSENPQYEYTKYKKVIDTFHKILAEEMMTNGTHYKLPHRLGTLGIRKKKSKSKRAVDFAKTKEYGVTIYHNNYHSEGFYAFYHWNKDFPQAAFTYKQLYKFVPTRYNKRTLARKISDNNSINKYLEI